MLQDKPDIDSGMVSMSGNTFTALKSGWIHVRVVSDNGVVGGQDHVWIAPVGQDNVDPGTSSGTGSEFVNGGNVPVEL